MAFRRAVAVVGAVAMACGAEDDLPGVPRIGTSPGKVIYATWGEVGTREREHWTLLNFEKNYTDLRVDLSTSPDIFRYVAELEAQIAAGTDPDVLRLPAGHAPNVYARGAVQKLDGVIKRDGYRTVNLAPPFDAGVWKRSWYGFPRAHTATWGVFCHVGRFASAGVPLPAPAWTWENLLVSAQRLSTPSQDQWGISVDPIAAFPLPWIWGVGGDDVDRDGRPQFESAPVREALAWMWGLRHIHQVAPPMGVARDIGAFISGQVAMWFGNGDDELALRRAGSPDFIFVPQPKGRMAQIAAWNPHVVAIAARAPNPDDAWELLQFLVDDDTQRLEFDQGLWLPQAKVITDTAEYRTSAQAPHDRKASISGAVTKVRSPIMTESTGQLRREVTLALAPFWDGVMPLDQAVRIATSTSMAVLGGVR